MNILGTASWQRPDSVEKGWGPRANFPVSVPNGCIHFLHDFAHWLAVRLEDRCDPISPHAPSCVVWRNLCNKDIAVGLL